MQKNNIEIMEIYSLAKCSFHLSRIRWYLSLWTVGQQADHELHLKATIGQKTLGDCVTTGCCAPQVAIGAILLTPGIHLRCVGIESDARGLVVSRYVRRDPEVGAGRDPEPVALTIDGVSNIRGISNTHGVSNTNRVSNTLWLATCCVEGGRSWKKVKHIYFVML